MAEFASTDSYHRFSQTVKLKARYVHDDEVREFLATVMATSESRRDSLEESAILFRAQRGYVWRKENVGEENEDEVQDALPPERMKPNAEFARDGRVSPRGIPCLYLASTKEAAMSEVRPWVGSYISLAQFKVMRELAIVDCSKDKRNFSHWLIRSEDIPAQKREEIVWGEIAYAFSRPVTPDEPITEYVPTQILAEAFRSHGYDGIVYRSLLGDGLNVALFDCCAAELINCGLYETNSVSFKFDHCSNPYFISKYYPELKKQQSEEPNNPPPTSPQTE
jgi:RES domain